MMLTLKFILICFSASGAMKSSQFLSQIIRQSVTFLWSCDTTANTFRQDYLEGEKIKIKSTLEKKKKGKTATRNSPSCFWQFQLPSMR